jgi:simple sugar transport system ATP-binding protein/ribose transport system ATP-binding protein
VVSAGAACSVRGIHKRYGAAVALHDVSLDVAAGEIHALVGENGAGKSTLGKVVAGAVAPDAGEILVDGEPVSYRSPREAIRYGIGLIEQEFALAPDLSVLDNVFLGVEPGRRGVVDRAQQRERFAELAERVGFRERPSAPVRTLRTADQQKVEILRQLVRDSRLIVMDEPTAALTRDEAQRLLQITRELRDDGVTVIYVSHVLGDVLALCDTVTVLKDGRHVKTAPAREETTDSLVTAMLGRSLDVAFPERTPPPAGAPVVLSVRGLSRPPAFDDISFEVRAGEIVGLAGLVGSGRTEIARAIFGADPASGTIAVEGRELRARSPRASIRRGLALLPESRKDQGLVMVRPLAENVTMAHLGEVSRRGVLQRRREHRLVRDTLRSVDARAASPALPVSSLSGGNQQKAALAKWLVKTPRLLLADEPTRGIDVGAKRAIYDLIRDLAADGLGVLLISSELEEVLGLAHRVIALRAGRIVGEYEGDEADEATVMRTVFGSV